MTEETEEKNHMRVIKEAAGAARPAESIWHHRAKRSSILSEKDMFKHGSLLLASRSLNKELRLHTG